MKWNIICDSSADLLKIDNLAPDTRFAVAPLKIYIDNQEFIDDAQLDVEKMVDAMVENKGSTSTACPSPFEWSEEYMQADYTIAITISSHLSGSYNAAVAAKDIVTENHPEKRVHVVDSRATSGTMILLARKVNELIKSGKSFEEVVNEIEQYNNTMQLTFCLFNFSNLVKQGRMNGFVGMIANALGLRAVAKKTPRGEIEVMSKQRGDNAVYRYLVDQMSTMKDLSKMHIIISHCRNAEGAKKIKQLLNEKYNAYNVEIIQTRGLCSFYAYVGGLIVSY